MSKERTAYVCTQCGYDTPKWIGRCPACGQWNTLSEVRLGSNTSARSNAHPSTRSSGQAATPQLLSTIPPGDDPRIDLHDPEFNRVLGGGLVPGSLTLLGGEPGIGKSTLVLQTALRLAPDLPILYVSGEESARQLKMRAERLGGGDLTILCETDVNTALDHSAQARLLIVDSIQTMSTDNVDSSPGSITQIRECTSLLLRYAKTTGTAVILIGHITKEGSIAGPKILEHMVDTVLQFEGDRQHMYRIVRAIKNRFGSTDELGIYEMQANGLRGVENPSELLVSDTTRQSPASGVAIACAMEGARPLLIETQALVSTAAYGTPQRSATGYDIRRLCMLLAVLEKRVGFKLAQKDVYLNIAGGLRITDPATDLAVVSAIISSNVDAPLPPATCLCGEVGLSGELRPVSRIQQRIGEAQRLGFTHIILPAANLPAVDPTQFSIHIQSAQRVEEALRQLLQ